MTESQLKYQQLMESRRHNMEMERLGQVEADVAEKNVSIATYNAKTNRLKAWTDVAGTVIKEQTEIRNTIYEPIKVFAGALKGLASLVG